MQPRRFDLLTRSCSGRLSRRQALRGVAAALSPTALALMAGDAAAKRKNKKKKKKKPSGPGLLVNDFGCVDVGNPCRGDDRTCCSGYCFGVAPANGKPDTSICVAHNVDICQPSDDFCGVDKACGAPSFSCWRTTGKASFCGPFADGQCEICSTDKDCEALGYPPGSACVVCDTLCPLTACIPPYAL